MREWSWKKCAVAGSTALLLLAAITSGCSSDDTQPRAAATTSASPSQPAPPSITEEEVRDGLRYSRAMQLWGASYRCTVNQGVTRASKLTPCPHFTARVEFRGNNKGDIPVFTQPTGNVTLTREWKDGCQLNDTGVKVCDPHWLVNWAFADGLQPFAINLYTKGDGTSGVWQGPVPLDYTNQANPQPAFDSRYMLAAEVYASDLLLQAGGNPLQDRGPVHY